MRILVLGGPRVGKTTLANELGAQHGVTPLRSDDLKTAAWSEQSEYVADWLHRPGPWVIEGVTVVRAVRKWLAWHDTGVPAEVLYLLRAPRAKLTKGQLSLMYGHEKIWMGIHGELVRRNANIVYR